MKTEIKTTARVDTANCKLFIEIENGELIVRDRWNKEVPVMMTLAIDEADFLAETIRAAIADHAAKLDAIGGAK